MADTPRNQDALNHDPATLRRRARRRLVGAVAIALTAVVVVPMLFDPDPKPLGSDVDIRIPAQETPFESPAEAGDAAPVVEPEPPAQAAEPTGVPAAVRAAEAEKAKPAEPTPTSPPPKATAPELPREAKKPLAKPTHEAITTSPAKPEAAFASKGYYLQLGAFGNEANAKALMQKAQDAGFKVSMADSNGQYRVRVGPIPDRDKATEILTKLRGKGFSPVMIGP
jgi:DedD protein